MVIDISQNIAGCRVFDGDTPPSFTRVRDIEHGYRLTDVTMCLHNGTHIDAPSHYISDGATVDEIPLEYCFGKCQVVFCHSRNIDISDINFSYKRLLFKGGQLDVALAERIVAQGVVIVGTTKISIADEQCDQVHKILLSHNVVVLEGLVLKDVKEGEYTLACFPLKFGGCEASPVRAVLITD